MQHYKQALSDIQKANKNGPTAETQVCHQQHGTLCLSLPVLHSLAQYMCFPILTIVTAFLHAQPAALHHLQVIAFMFCTGLLDNCVELFKLQGMSALSSGLLLHASVSTFALSAWLSMVVAAIQQHLVLVEK